RNLCYLGLVEILYGYFIDGVVLTTGCDKTTPAQLMAAATVDLPAIVVSGGPMLNGWYEGKRTGSGTIVWKGRELLAARSVNDDWEKVGYDVPLLVNLQPAGEYLGEEYYRAGGVPAVVNELIKAGRIRKNTITVNGKSLHDNCKARKVQDPDVIWPYSKPMK